MCSYRVGTACAEWLIFIISIWVTCTLLQVYLTSGQGQLTVDIQSDTCVILIQGQLTRIQIIITKLTSSISIL
jgi:hypothetical protein